ncbi:MAG: 23S rRNA (guanosine(2251)-2'-O)-methyltransferase RlmB [Ruminococcaceae bacterium]|nr:23S rRNA (guanosine(2251)-2'-O)-methyltransferase RlmB [Oscillospiraceae bacterium]
MKNNDKNKAYKKDGGRKDSYRPRETRRDFDESENSCEAIYGRNAVLELLKTDRDIDKIFILTGEREGSVKLIESRARERAIPVINAPKEKLDRISNGGVHQGVAAFVSEVQYADVDDIFAVAEERGQAPFIVIADGIEDPHNLGALIRCADAAGAHGIIIPKRRNVAVTATVVKSSAGASGHVKIARVSNIAMTIDALKKRGVWVYGAEAGGEDVYNTDMTGAAAFVFGSEGNGISRLVTDKCDCIVSIPMYGQVNSLNVSCASAVVLCEAARQRKAKQ